MNGNMLSTKFFYLGRSLDFFKCANLQQSSKRSTTDWAIVRLIAQTISAQLAKAEMSARKNKRISWLGHANYTFSSAFVVLVDIALFGDRTFFFTVGIYFFGLLRCECQTFEDWTISKMNVPSGEQVCFQCHKYLEGGRPDYRHKVFVWEPSVQTTRQKFVLSSNKLLGVASVLNIKV